MTCWTCKHKKDCPVFRELAKAIENLRVDDVDNETVEKVVSELVYAIALSCVAHEEN